MKKENSNANSCFKRMDFNLSRGQMMRIGRTFCAALLLFTSIIAIGSFPDPAEAAVTLVSGATYKIKHADSGKYLDTDADGAVSLASNSIYDDQDWIVTQDASGDWTIDNVRTGREYLNTDPSNIVTWNTGGGIYDDALWSFEETTGGYRINNKATDRDYLYATTADEVRWNTGSTDSSTVWIFELVQFGETIIQPDDPNIEYYGRWDKSASASYHSYWGGAYLKVRFTGTSVELKLDKATTLLVNIDDTGDRMFSNVNGTVNLTPTPLSLGTHTLRVAAQFDTKEIVFKGLVLDPGATTEAPLVSNNKIIEFIGDSITTGADNPYGDGDAFAWLAGDLLGAQHTQISDPGIALVDGYGAHSVGMESAYYKLQTPNYSTTTNWNFSNYTPDAIVINLGSNDYYTDIDPALFQSRYIDFLADVRNIYPNAEIFGIRLFNGWFETEVKNAVDARIAAGDTKVHYVDTTGWLEGYGSPTTEDYVIKDSGVSVHPSRLGHVKVAKNLAPILDPYLNQSFTQVRVEAEDMSLSNYEVESNEDASFLNNIRVPSSGTGTASYTFTEATGTYDLQVNYFDENDGASTYSLYVDNTLVGSWTADQDLGSAGPDLSVLTAKMFSNVSISQGSVIKIEGAFDNFEAARIDRLKIFSQ